MEQNILSQVQAAVTELASQPNVSRPSADEIRRAAESFGLKTQFGNYSFVSSIKNRSAGVTVYVGGPGVAHTTLTQKRREILNSLPETLRLVHSYMKKAPFVQVKATMGDNDVFSPKCTLYMSTYRKEMVRLAHMVNQTLFPSANKPGPDFNIIFIPEWQEKDRQILVFPEIGVTYVLGSDYYGEAKKGFLRMGMWHAKQQGMLGLHAGTKIIRARNKGGKLQRLGMVIFGLTATGKTTHSCHSHDLNGDDEGVEIVQDDVVFWHKDGSAYGTERGFYIKTEGLDPEIQPLLYYAATRPDAILENVMVDYQGNVDFSDQTLTGNGRGIIQRTDLGEYMSETINLPPIDELDGLIMAFIVRRNTVVPIASKLSPEQAAAAFMLGESVESSGSDPKRAGESVREVGTNPFIIGDESQEGNIFYEFVKAHQDKIQCFMLNTGGIGEVITRDLDGTRHVKRRVTRVQIPEMSSIIRGIARGTIEWHEDMNWMVNVPKVVEGCDIDRFSLDKFYDSEQSDYLINELRRERAEYMARFPGLDPAIIKAAEF
ncbi:MAG TPA: phosphoenolpyruvate carboxykinase [Armatimonadota bacterium]|nr:phosphoenolpyruvate carboxykinase [Armatimonadota bacterium]HPP73986.1 phosphoenolpyruvate carboxykinase [Armatimonadota bacterium]